MYGWIALVLLTTLNPAFSGIDLDPIYYLRLIRGQARILWRQEPIERVLREKDLSPAVGERLRFVQEVRQFAENRLGLARSRNYTTYCDIGDGPVSWNLTACPKDRLEPVVWSYPVVGRAPYRGFFDRPAAASERDRLEVQGYDTYLRPVSAYSTLGWFTDPILSPMLRYSDEDLAGLIIHELTHATVWIAGNVAFNESLATFVEGVGVHRFLEARYGADSSNLQAVLDRRADRDRFLAFMRGIVEELEEIYGSELSYEGKVSRREDVFGAAKERFGALPWKTDLYDGFPRWRLNNARLVSYRTYHRDIDVFHRVLDALGGDLKAAVGIFRGCEGAKEPVEHLERWLRERATVPEAGGGG